MNKQEAPRPGYFDNVEAYQLVDHFIDMMLDGDCRYTKRKQKQLRSIQKSMKTGIQRNTEKAYAEKKPQPRKKAVTPIAGKRRRVSRKRRVMDDITG